MTHEKEDGFTYNEGKVLTETLLLNKLCQMVFELN